MSSILSTRTIKPDQKLQINYLLLGKRIILFIKQNSRKYRHLKINPIVTVKMSANIA